MPSKSALLSSAQAVVTANETAAAKTAAKPAAKPRSTSRRPAPAAQPSAPAASAASASTPKTATPRRASTATTKPASPASTIAKIATQVIAQAQPASSEMDQVIDKAAQSPKLREKAPAKTAAKPVEKAVKTAQKAEKPAKKSAKKAKLIRDSFTFPADDYALIATTKQRILSAGVEVKKSELIRAGLKALAAMDNAQLLALVDGLEKIKTGRPSK
jgi:hypothetical protein